jgi:CheY-like chemotaxis protein
MANILVIDDQEETCVLLARLFKSCGHSADWVSSGAAAMQHVRDHQFDFVLLDFMMPDLDGLDTLRKLRGVASTASIPIVIYTAISDSKFQEFARQCGATDVWVKGQCDFPQILERMKPMLGLVA